MSTYRQAAKMDNLSRVTIKAAIREMSGIKSGDELAISVDDNKRIIIEKLETEPHEVVCPHCHNTIN
jgi:AbrB family looped-hinge helix DNA binding protein